MTFRLLESLTRPVSEPGPALSMAAQGLRHLTAALESRRAGVLPAARRGVQTVGQLGAGAASLFRASVKAAVLAVPRAEVIL